MRNSSQDAGRGPTARQLGGVVSAPARPHWCGAFSIELSVSELTTPHREFETERDLDKAFDLGDEAVNAEDATNCGDSFEPGAGDLSSEGEQREELRRKAEKGDARANRRCSCRIQRADLSTEKRRRAHNLRCPSPPRIADDRGRGWLERQRCRRRLASCENVAASFGRRRWRR